MRWPLEFALEKNLSVGHANDRIFLLIHDWTLADYQAVGKWLTISSDGSVKNTAVKTYAATVSKYESQAAAQWALPLPVGKDRDWTIVQIYQNCPTEDPAGKDAFAEQHEIPEISE